MRYHNRLGVVVLFCAIPCVSMLTPAARGGVVNYRDDDDSKRSIASKDGCGDSEWVEKILGSHDRRRGNSDHPGKHKGHDKDKHDKDKNDKKDKKHDDKHSAPTVPDVADYDESPTGPRPAAVIPLPAP